MDSNLQRWLGNIKAHWTEKELFQIGPKASLCPGLGLQLAAKLHDLKEDNFIYP